MSSRQPGSTVDLATTDVNSGTLVRDFTKLRLVCFARPTNSQDVSCQLCRSSGSRLGSLSKSALKLSQISVSSSCIGIKFLPLRLGRPFIALRCVFLWGKTAPLPLFLQQACLYAMILTTPRSPNRMDRNVKDLFKDAHGDALSRRATTVNFQELPAFGALERQSVSRQASHRRLLLSELQGLMAILAAPASERTLGRGL